jgi:hypothetical protein
MLDKILAGMSLMDEAPNGLCLRSTLWVCPARRPYGRQFGRILVGETRQRRFDGTNFKVGQQVSTFVVHIKKLSLPTLKD